jgi:hypothetical protein
MVSGLEIEMEMVDFHQKQWAYWSYPSFPRGDHNSKPPTQSRAIITLNP